MTPAPAPEVLEAMRAAFKQRSSQMMGDPGKLDYNAIELEAFAAAAGALAAAGWRPPVAVPAGEREAECLYPNGVPMQRGYEDPPLCFCPRCRKEPPR